jgi:hypothetical protein
VLFVLVYVVFISSPSNMYWWCIGVPGSVGDH